MRILPFARFTHKFVQGCCAIWRFLCKTVQRARGVRHDAPRRSFSAQFLSAKTIPEEFAVYLVRSGRMCVAGLNSRNVDYVADAMAAVLKG